LQSIDDSLALIVVVGDDEGATRVFTDGADADDPGIEFVGGIEIVIALVSGRGGVVAEPGVVATAVEADVSDGRSGFRGRNEGTADERLVDVAEAGVLLAKEFESLLGLPGGVTEFDDEGVISEALENRREVSDSLAVAMKREGELEEDGPELSRLVENIKTGADGALVFPGGGGIVGEFLPKLCGEKKGGVPLDALEPESGVIGTQRLIEGSIDFDGVKKLREIGGFVKTFRAMSRVNIA